MPHAPDASTNVVQRDYSIVVFVNIDWKKSRQETEKAKKSNMVIIEGTVRSIIQIHKPVVICFCEVGVSSRPLTLDQMSTVSQAIEDTWHELLQSTQLQLFSNKDTRISQYGIPREYIASTSTSRNAMSVNLFEPHSSSECERLRWK